MQLSIQNSVNDSFIMKELGEGLALCPNLSAVGINLNSSSFDADDGIEYLVSGLAGSISLNFIKLDL